MTPRTKPSDTYFKRKPGPKRRIIMARITPKAYARLKARAKKESKTYSEVARDLSLAGAPRVKDPNDWQKAETGRSAHKRPKAATSELSFRVKAEDYARLMAGAKKKYGELRPGFYASMKIEKALG